MQAGARQYRSYGGQEANEELPEEDFDLWPSLDAEPSPRGGGGAGGGGAYGGGSHRAASHREMGARRAAFPTQLPYYTGCEDAREFQQRL